MRLHHLAATALLLLACSPSLPPPEAPLPAPPPAPPPPTAEPVAAPPAPDPPQPPAAAAAPKMGDHALVFKAKTGDWTNQIVIAPWGDVVAVGGHKARLLARHSGEELLRFPVCFVQSPDAAAFVDDKHMLVACGEGVDEVTFPEGSVKRVLKLPLDHALTAVGGGRVVVAADGFFKKDDFKVRVHALPSFKVVDEFDAGAPVRAVGVSADGLLVAAGLEGKGLLVRDTTKKVSRRYLEDGDRKPSPARFSPDKSSVFTYPRSFTGGEIDLASGKVRRSLEVSSWISAVRHVDADKVLLTGAGGLMLFSGQSTVIKSPVDDLGEGLDVSADGSFFCAAGRSGIVACFSNKPVAPSTFARPKPSDPDKPSSGPAKVAVSIDGRIVSRAGKTLVISAPGAGSAAAGRRGELMKSFDIGILRGKMVVAVVEVKKVDGDRLTLTIVEEKSAVTMNGKKLDHFAPKTEVTLTLD